MSDKPTIADMLNYLQTKYDPGRAILLRPPGSYGFIELSHDQWRNAINDLKMLLLKHELGEKANELEKLGIQMLLGYDYEYFMKKD